MKQSLILLLLLMVFGSCSSNSGTGSNPPPTGSTSNYGATYFPLTDNTLWEGHLVGTVVYTDENGQITRKDELNQDYGAVLGFSKTQDGRSVHPVVAYDKNGIKIFSGKPIGYFGVVDSQVFGQNRESSDVGTFLPKILTVGQKWSPAPTAYPIRCEATLVQRLVQFTTKGGTTYSDVIQVGVSYFDSTWKRWIIDSALDKVVANADMYFANGVGVIELDVHNNDNVHYYKDSQTGELYNYKHTTATGSIWRKN